jgi:hypothetical protein
MAGFWQLNAIEGDNRVKPACLSKEKASPALVDAHFTGMMAAFCSIFWEICRKGT